MADENSILYRPTGVWANDVGDYALHCLLKENPDGSFLITVVENGVELERELLPSSNTQEARERATSLRPKYEARYQAEIAKRTPR